MWCRMDSGTSPLCVFLRPSVRPSASGSPELGSSASILAAVSPRTRAPALNMTYHSGPPRGRQTNWTCAFAPPATTTSTGSASQPRLPRNSALHTRISQELISTSSRPRRPRRKDNPRNSSAWSCKNATGEMGLREQPSLRPPSAPTLPSQSSPGNICTLFN